MQKQLTTHDFIGRSSEIDTFMRWLSNPTMPSVLYIHDALEEANKKGGVGKTWLLRKYTELVQQHYQDIAVVMIDFFNIADRDRVTIAERAIAGLQILYPQWSPTMFNEAIEQSQAETVRAEGLGESDPHTQETLSSALAADLQRLEQYLQYEHKTLLLFFDTFEVIEQTPAIAVLRPAQTFPDTYHFEHIRVVIAGRNKLDWSHANWVGREHDVVDVALNPFNRSEMLHYLEEKATDDISQQSLQTLYKLTEGRPILLGLVVDVLRRHILSLSDLSTISKTDFEGYLVAQINKLENPLNWIILFMAHVYHSFTIPILEWILRETELQDLAHEIQLLEPLTALPQLSFVRRPSVGDTFVLHDEMRRLVVKYCWDSQDPEGVTRAEISRSIIRYYEQKIAQTPHQQEQQPYIIEELYHLLYINLDEGLRYFQQHFHSATQLWQTVFARLLLQEAQKFSTLLSPSQHNDIQLTEAKLERIEESVTTALARLQQLMQLKETEWYKEHQGDLLLEEGRCYLYLSKLPEAASSFSQCLVIEQARGNTIQSAHLLANLGAIARLRGQFATALDYYDSSLALYKNLGDQRNYANALTSISIVYRLQGKMREALHRAKIAWRIRLELFEDGKIGEVPVGLSLSTLGMNYLSSGNVLEAERCLKEAFDIYWRRNYKDGLATTYIRLGEVQLAKGELTSAAQLFEKAQQSAQGNNTIQYINSLNKQGRVHALQLQWEEAKTFFEQAIALARQLPDYYQQTQNLIDLANALRHLGHISDVLHTLQIAEVLASNENYIQLLGLVAEIKGDMYYEQRDYTTSFTYFAVFCHQMALYDYLTFETALRKITDALLGIPRSEVSAMVQSLLTYWKTQHLEDEYPALIEMLEETDELIM